MQHAGHQYGPGALSSSLQPPPPPYEPPPQQQISPSGLSITSSLRQWRKKDAQQQPPPQQQQPLPQQQPPQPPPLTSTTDPTLPQIPPISENGSHVARVAPQAHYSRPSTDVYRFPPQYPDYGLSFKDINSPGKYSEIVDNGLSHLSQDPKEKEYLNLKMCSIQQQHLKQYPDPSLKPPYPGGPIKQSSYDTSLHPQMHPYMQKESPIPPYMQKDMQYTPQCFQKFNMQPPQYGNNYAPESNSFLATLSKINPRMAQSIISDPHIREASMGYHNVEQNHGYTHAQRLYPSQPGMHTSPGFQGGHRNLAAAPQGYSCAQQYGYKPPPESYNRLPQYQAPNPLGQPPNHELSTRQPYRDNIPLPMNYSAMPQKLSQCAQLEYSQHYQHRRYQMPPDYYPQNYKNPYIQNQDLPSVAVAETAVPSARMKQFWESFGEEEVEAIPEATTSDPDKRKEDRPTEQLFVLGATEIPRDSLGQYVEIEALPENMRELYENGSIIIKATTAENSSVQDMEVVASSSNRINILDHKRILPGATAAEAEQVVNLHILEAPNPQGETTSKQTEPETEWFVDSATEEKGAPKSMPTISDMFEEAVTPEQVAETESQSEVCKASVEEASPEKKDEQDLLETAETTKDSITDLFKTEVEHKTNNIPEEEIESGKSKVVEGCSVIVSRRKTIEEIVQKITFKKNCEQESTSGCNEEVQEEPKEDGVVEEVHDEQVNPEEEEKATEEITTALEDSEIDDSLTDLQERPEDDKAEDEEPQVFSEGAEAHDEIFKTGAAGGLKEPPTPTFNGNVITVEEPSETQENVQDSVKPPLKVDAFQLENNNVVIHLDGALVEIKVSYEGKKKVITVVPYAGDSESEVSEIEEEAHLKVPLDALENNNGLEEEQKSEEVTSPAEAEEEVVIDATDSRIEEEVTEEELQKVEEVARVEVEAETVEEEAAILEEQAVVDAVDSTEEEAIEEDLQQIEEMPAAEVEVETVEEEAEELEEQAEEVENQKISAIDPLLPEKTENKIEQVLGEEATKEEEDHSIADVEVDETKCWKDSVLEDEEDILELEGDLDETEVDQPLTEVEVEEQSLEEVFLETEIAAEGKIDERVLEEKTQMPVIEEGESDDEVFLEPNVVTEEGTEEVASQEIDKIAVVEEQSDDVGVEEPAKTEINEGDEHVIENAIFEADVSGEVIIGSPTSVDKIEIEEAVADSTQTSITVEPETQKPSLLTKASRKHFSDDDMAVKSETQTKMASKRKRELRERRVTIAEDLPRDVMEDEELPLKKVRFGKARVPMINSSNKEGSMRDQVEEATFHEKLFKRRKAKFEEKSYCAIDLTKNRDGGARSSKHHHSRSVRPTHTKDLPECEVTTTTKTVEDKIEVPAPNEFQTRTDESEVTSSTKVVVNAKTCIFRSVSEDSSDGGHKKRLTLAEYTSRKKRLNSSASPATEVPLESQEILKQFTKKLLNPPVEKAKVIDINAFDIPTRSQELDEIRKSPSYTIENPETVKTFQEEINFKLQSLDFQLIKQKQKERNDLLMRRFLNNEKLTEEEMQKVKEIIHCKRMLVEMNKVRMQKLATEQKYERLDASSNLKLHLKKIVEAKPRKRFRNLYADSSSESEDEAAPAQTSRDPRINRRLHGETVESDYLAYQTKVKNGVPKIIIRRRLPHNNNSVMQPYVKLERSPQIDLLAKRRRVC